MKRRNFLTIMLAVIAAVAFTLGISMTVSFSAKAEEETAADLSGWGWGTNEKEWTNTKHEDGSYTIKQGAAGGENRYATGAQLKLDGLSLTVTFNAPGAFVFGPNPWGCYATDSGLVFRLTNDYNRGNILISSNGTEAGMKFYETAEDALAQTNKGTKVDGVATGSVIFTSKTPTIKFDFKKYSTRRYKITLTSDSLYSGMNGRTDNSVSYFINTDDFSALFEIEATSSVKLIAIGNTDGNAEMTIRAVQGAASTDVIDDAAKVDEAWEAMVNGTVIPSEGKKIVPFTNDDVVKVDEKFSSEAEILENGLTVVSNPTGAAWGERTGMNKNLQLDGLKITSFYTNAKVGSMVSFILGDTPWGYYGEGNLCVSYKYYADNQARIYVGSNHDFEGSSFTSYMYNTKDGAEAKNAADKRASIIFDGAQVKYSVEFEKVTDEVYSMTFKVLNGIAFHWANGFPEGTTDSITMYINVSEMYGGQGEDAGNHLFVSDGYVILATATEMGNVDGMKAAYYVELPEGAVMDAEITLESETVELNGETANAVVKSVTGDGVVISAENYDVTYVNNDSIGTATVIITFKNGYSGVFTKNYQVVGKNASAAVITLEQTSFVYTTFEQEPAVTSVKLGETVIPASDYTVSYKNNTNIGTATVVVTFKNAYSGKAETTFEITKIQKTVEAQDVVLDFGNITFEAIKTLGEDYVYTIKDAEGNEVTDVTSIKAGVYTVTAVKESSTTVETAEFTLTVNEEKKGCLAGVGMGGTILGIVCLAASCLLRKKEQNR